MPTGSIAFIGPLLLTTSDFFFSLLLTSITAKDFSFLLSSFAVPVEIFNIHTPSITDI